MRRTNILILLVLLFAGTQSVYAQNYGMHGRKHKQLMQLEQMKLIETLDLDEEASVRFFARKKALIEKLRSLQKEKNGIIDELAKKLKAGEKVNSKKYGDEIYSIESRILEEKKKFYDSLDDIFTNEQKAKYLVFEYRFRKEVMRTMMKKHRGGMKNIE